MDIMIDKYSKIASQGATDTTMLDIIMAWHSDVLQMNHAQGVIERATYDREVSLLNTKVVPSIGHMPLNSIKPTHIQEMINSIYGEGYSRDTLDKTLSIVSRVFRYAALNGIMYDDMTKFVTIPKVRKMKVESESYTPEECAAVLRSSSQMFDGRFYLLFNFLALWGVRPGEALALKAEDIDEKENFALVRHSLAKKKYNEFMVLKATKTEQSTRRIHLTKHMRYTIKWHADNFDIHPLPYLNKERNVYSQKTGLFFYATKAGKPLMYKPFLDIFYKPIVAAANVEYKPPTAFRRNTTTILYSAGGDAKDQEEMLLGHSSAVAKRNYLDYKRMGSQQKAVETIEAEIRKNQKEVQQRKMRVKTIDYTQGKLFLTKEVLYRLSYEGYEFWLSIIAKKTPSNIYIFASIIFSDIKTALRNIFFFLRGGKK